MSSRLLSPLAATLVGVGAGLYIWVPYWQERLRNDQLEKDSQLPPNMVEIPVQEAGSPEQRLQYRPKNTGEG
ncbi:hypothetical protein LTS08_007798 [Lithohypha guttulata]|uniref:Uncharacterized protein n=1 Tax=Lithohypha guttulata TaxID=1690604 RepID=A0AAN7STN7_9EURO|nr:hypothetical protein LTR51_007451 [Lithohypha guttulata]KAK5081222.1 hypothetical protein LTR05_008016 [Lithohypha guttulata]KAK5096192.1 hypothetical protein LTS08_007798 [Lithohypha guttulata]